MIDFHSHILPGIDDGAKDIKESLLMLESLKEQGVSTVVATPHYYGECPVEEFLHNRDTAYSQLLNAIKKDADKYPDVVLGAEVLFGQYLFEIPEIDHLCIEGTNYILIEMPTGIWPSYLLSTLYYFSEKYELNLMIAHADRYCSLYGKNNKSIYGFIENKCTIQINTSSLLKIEGKMFFDRFVKRGAQIVLGSDCHNTEQRPPVVSEPVSYVEKKYGCDFISTTTNKIFNR